MISFRQAGVIFFTVIERAQPKKPGALKESENWWWLVLLLPPPRIEFLLLVFVIIALIIILIVILLIGAVHIFSPKWII